MTTNIHCNSNKNDCELLEPLHASDLKS